MPSASNTAQSTLRLAGQVLGLTVGVPAIPILAWWKSARDDRAAHEDSVKHKVRIPNVQTVDDLLIEKCRPGDVVLFDRRCDRCADGPMAALSCLLGRSLLCDERNAYRSTGMGLYDHVGIIVPGKNGNDLNDELHLLEATPGAGIVSRPLLTRLEMSRSRNVTLIPLSSAGEYRNDDDYEPSSKTKRLRDSVDRLLTEFRDEAVRVNDTRDYASLHSWLAAVGAASYALGVHDATPAPVSPSAWLVVSALQAAGLGENVERRAALDAKPEDFLRDHRFTDDQVVRLRPGWKVMNPVTMRENSRS